MTKMKWNLQKCRQKKWFMGGVYVMAVTVLAIPFLMGCGRNGSNTTPEAGNQNYKGYSNTVDTMELAEAVKNELGENYYPNTQMESQMLEDVYGVESGSYEEFYGEIPAISTNVDTLVIVKANEGCEDEIEQALVSYMENSKADTMQYPMNIGKIQSSQVKTFGNYVCFVQLGGNVMEAMDQGDEAVIKQCQAMNEQALNIIEERLKS